MDDELTLEASIELLLGQVPPPVRAFVLNELAPMSNTLMERHRLHVDQGGVLEAQLLLMLLGQATPEEFVRELTNAGIPEETVRNIVADVNRDVFMRLRKEEQAAPVPQPAPVSPPSIERAPVPIYSPLPSPAPAAPPPYVTEAVERPAAPKQVAPPINLPGQLPERPTPPPAPRLEVTVAPAPAPEKTAAAAPDGNTRIIHTMARDMQALKSGIDPLRVAHPAPPSWAAVSPQAAPSSVPPSPPASLSPAQPVRPLPSTPVPPPQPVQAPAPAPVPSPTLPHEPLTAHLKQYGVDPYREPIE